MTSTDGAEATLAQLRQQQFYMVSMDMVTPTDDPLSVLAPHLEEHRDGVIGELAPRFLPFMGAQADPTATLAEAAEQAADLLVADGVDVVVLTPT